ncbi:MAG: CdaR family protein [Lachnospiraceae bacterium]|nr:CdaR family protein [Lachnospiraceae bacterium]
MKKKLTNNIGMKLLSIGIAIVFWIVIVNSQDPVESRKFKNIPVQVLNEEQVIEREKVLEVIEGDTVDVVVEGRRSELEQLTEKDFYATADLAEVSFMDTVLIRVTVPSYPGVTVLNNAENVMKLLFDDYVTKRFSFKVDTVGETTPGYYVGDALPSPNIIQISGAKTVLDKINEVVLVVDVSGRSVDFTTTAVPTVYDMNGDEISPSKLTMQAESEAVTVNVPILASKEMKIVVETVGEVPEGYEILPENIAFQPETICVAGKKEDLEKLGNSLRLEVDVTGQTGIIEKNIQVSAELDDALASLRVVNTQMVAVTVTVTPYIEREIEIPVSEIEFKNLPDWLTAKHVHSSDISVTLKCRAVRAPLITVDYLNPYVDLEGCTEGTYSLPLQMNLPSKVLWDEAKEVELVVYKR